MSPATLRVKRGDTLSRVFTWKDADGVAIDLSGCSARLQVRNREDAAAISVTSATSALAIEPVIGETDTTNRHNTTLGTSNQTTAAEQWNYTLDSFDADGYNFDYTEVGTSGDIGFTLAIQFESAVTPIIGYWAMDGVIEA